MKSFRHLILVGALAVNMLGIAALASAQDATPEATVPAPATEQAAPPTAEAPAPRPYLGIVFEAADGGVAVVEVAPDGPAAAAGIETGDVITAIGDTAVTEDNIRETLHGFAVGDAVSVALTRAGETVTVTVTLGEAPADLTVKPVRPGRGEGRPDIRILPVGRPLLGIGIQDSDTGVTVTSVTEGSAAEAAGIAVDDVITAINGTPVATAEETAQAVADAGDAAAVGEFDITVSLTRAGEAIDVTATLTKSDMPAMPDFGMGRGGHGFDFGMGGLQIVPRDGEEGKFDVIVPFTPADPTAVTQDVIDSLAAIGITIAPREGEDGVFDLTIPAESLGNGGLMLPGLRDFGFAFPHLRGGDMPAKPDATVTPEADA